MREAACYTDVFRFCDNLEDRGKGCRLQLQVVVVVVVVWTVEVWTVEVWKLGVVDRMALRSQAPSLAKEIRPLNGLCSTTSYASRISHDEAVNLARWRTSRP